MDELPQTNQGETVTLFNDLCLFAPAALVDAPIEWEPIDDRLPRDRDRRDRLERERRHGACGSDTAYHDRRRTRGHHTREAPDVTTIKHAATDFLANKRIAVTGVSSKPKGHGSNTVYQRLRSRGYDVFAVNPNADHVEGDTCYHDLTSIPDGVDAVVIATRPEHADATMAECAELGINHVWMHRGPGAGSVSHSAATYGRENGITVIDGGCPLMFDPTADFAHKCMKAVFTLTRKMPKEV